MNRESTKSTRRPRLRRVADAPPMALTPRDRGIVLAVYSQRFLRRDQIAAVFFPASPHAKSETLVSSCNARLQRLFHHGYLSRSMRTSWDGSSQAVYALDRRGAALVAETLGVDLAAVRWSPKQRRSELYFRDHTLAINDVWVAVHMESRTREDFKLINWAMDGPDLWDRVPDPQARHGHLPVRPDAYFTLELAGRRAHFFLEVDRATMTNRRFGEKVRAYQLYWQSGAFKRAYTAPSFRVLVTAPSGRRRDNLRRTATKEGARGMFLFAAHDELIARGMLAPIWRTASGADARSIAS